MRRVGWFGCVAAGVGLAGGLVASLPRIAVRAAESDTPASPAITWDRQAAARYLDSREVWWQAWDHDKRDHGSNRDIQYQCA